MTPAPQRDPSFVVTASRITGEWWFYGAASISVAIVISLAGPIGFAGLLAIPLLLAMVRDFRIAVLGMVASLPTIGDRDIPGSILPHLWLIPFTIAAASWLIHALAKPRRLLFSPVATSLFGCIIVVAVASLLQGFDLRTVPDSFRPFDRVQLFFAATSLFLFGMSAVRTEADLRRIFRLLVVTGIPYAVLLPFFNKEMESGGRSYGIFSANAAAALHMQICAISAVALVRSARHVVWRVVLVLAALGYLGTQIFTLSKTTMASLPVLVGLWMLMQWGWRKTTLYFLAMALLLVAMFPVLPTKLQKPLTSIVTLALASESTKQARSGGGKGDISTYQDRLIQYKRARELIQERPLLGFGLGASGWVSNIPASAAGRWVHSYYYLAAIETGLIGLALGTVLTMVVILGVLKVNRSARAQQRFELQDMSAALILIMLTCLIMFLTVTGVASGERHFWFFAGMMACMPRLLVQDTLCE